MKKITQVLSNTRVPGYLPGTRVTGIETGTRLPVPSTNLGSVQKQQETKSLEISKIMHLC